MDVTYRTKAIILTRSDVGESDTRVSVYSSAYGRQNLLARGTKKLKSKLAGHLEPLCLSELMVVSGRKSDYIGAAIAQKCFVNIKENYERVMLAGGALRLFNQAVKENVKDECLYELLSDYLDLMDDRQKNESVYAFITSAFILKLLAALGQCPELYKCLNCQRQIEPGKNFFSLSRGGVICPVCAPRLLKDETDTSLLTVSETCVKVLRFVLDNSLKESLRLTISKQLNQEINKIISSFYKYISA